VNSGDPAAPDDIWLRAITNENHIRRTGVHHAELKKWLGPPDDSTKPWKLELSGRLRSLVGSISKDALEKVAAQKAKLIASNKSVPSTIKYCGVVHSTVDGIKSIADFDGDVIYDPTEDLAHANIVVRDKGPNEILTVTDVLLKHLTFLMEPDVVNSPLFSSCS
jgi:hypothetical protein